MPQIAGGCLCGKVRYSANAEPAFTGVCHCTDCQKYGGSAFSVVVGLPKDALSVQGKMTTYSKSGDSGQPTQRSFCPECGSPIVEEVAVMPGMVMIGAGTLDDTDWVKPGMEIFCDSAQSWVDLAGEMKRFPKMPG
jgi:hypothetical protein